MDHQRKYPIIGLNLGKEYKFYYPRDIIYCQSEGNYTKVFFFDGTTTMTAKKLKDLEALLPESIFVRIHHSFIINLMYVVKFTNDESKTLEMTNGHKVNISRRKKTFFLSKFLKL